MRNLSQFTVLCGTLLLVGCGGGASEMLGLGRHSPDEFAVVDRAPLSLPPDYDLRPPKPGASRPQEIEMTNRANQILFGGQRMDGAGIDPSASEAEQVILKSAGAGQADPNIRKVIDREADERVVGSQNLVDDLLWWHQPDNGAATVDAAEEAKRLREAKEKNEPLTKEPTPIIEKNKGGWLF